MGAPGPEKACLPPARCFQRHLFYISVERLSFLGIRLCCLFELDCWFVAVSRRLWATQVFLSCFQSGLFPDPKQLLELFPVWFVSGSESLSASVVCALRLRVLAAVCFQRPPCPPLRLGDINQSSNKGCSLVTPSLCRVYGFLNKCGLPRGPGFNSISTLSELFLGACSVVKSCKPFGCFLTRLCQKSRFMCTVVYGGLTRQSLRGDVFHMPPFHAKRGQGFMKTFHLVQLVHSELLAGKAR